MNGRGRLRFGLVMTGVGLAMVVGSVVMSAWRGPERLARTMVGMIVVAGLALFVSGLRPSLRIAGGSVMAFMFFMINGISQTLWQRKVEPAIQGRACSTRRIVATIASPVAYVVAGPLADGVFDGSALLVVLAGLGVVVVAAAARSFPAVRNIERDAPDAPVEFEAAVAA